MESLTKNKFATLVRREYIENRNGFLRIPLILAGLLLFFSFMAVVVGVGQIPYDQIFDGKVSSLSELIDAGEAKLESEMAEEGRSEEEVEATIDAGITIMYWALSSFAGLAMPFVIFFALLGALYEERRDKSVLFWKSMPVSDWLTVASKLTAGLVLAPALYLGFVMIAHLLLVTVSSLAAIGQEIDVWNTLWVPANLIGRWLTFIGLYGFTLLWCLPFFAWLLLVSSWAKSAPLAWAVGIPVTVVLVEGMLINTSFVNDFIRHHTFSFEFWHQASGVLEDFELWFAMEMFLSLVVGMAFVYGAVWFRGKADEM